MSENANPQIDAANDTALTLSFQDILDTIPHRYPFLFIDKVESLVLGKSIVAVKNVSFGDNFFLGHFPQEPVMPGVIQIEALAQAACILIAKSFPAEAQGKRPAFAGIDDARFRRAVRPGDILKLHVELESFRRGFATVKAQAQVDGKVVSEATIKATLV